MLLINKTGKFGGFDNIHPENSINAKVWMAHRFAVIVHNGNIPKEFKQSKIIAILKPGKPAENPKSYRQIALLSVIYKLMEQLSYNRISTRIFGVIPVEKAGFRPKRCCAYQVISLTTYIEEGFQRKLKTSAVLIDLSAA